MKKIFTLLIALTAFFGAFAQRNMPADNRHYNDYDCYYDDQSDHAIVITTDNNKQQRNGYYNDYNRRAELERINHDYDRRINDYRTNRRLNAYERERNIQRIEKERSEKLKAFGGGILVGGILGVILGTHL